MPGELIVLGGEDGELIPCLLVTANIRAVECERTTASEMTAGKQDWAPEVGHYGAEEEAANRAHVCRAPDSSEVPCECLASDSVTVDNTTKPWATTNDREHIQSGSVCMPKLCKMNGGLVIYCHANGEDLGSLQEVAEWIVAVMGTHVLIPEYPGYGMALGEANEVSVMRAVRAAYTFATRGLGWQADDVFLFGRSIGTGPAVQVADSGVVTSGHVFLVLTGTVSIRSNSDDC